MAVSAIEQHFVYLLNWARHDPVAYQIRHNLPVDLSDVDPQPPLAINDSLNASADFHSQEMSAYNYFGHQSEVTGDWPNQMARDAGYELPGHWEDDNNFIESLAAGTLIDTAAESLDLLVIDEGVPSLGHRRHLLGMGDFYAGNREIGVGHSASSSSDYTNYWTIHATRTSESDRFLTGVIYDDANGNKVYDQGEGLANVSVQAGSQTVTTNAAGGWSLEVGDGTYNVTASGPGFVGQASSTVTVAGQNVEVDFISGRASGIIDFDASDPPPVVNAVRLNSNLTDPPDRAIGPQPTSWATQRSELRTIEIEFDRPVNVNANDLQLVNRGVDGSSTPVSVPITTQHLAVNANFVTLEFGLRELPQGVYELTLSDNISDSSGVALDGNHDGVAGGSFVYQANAENRFYTLDADWNGDGGISVFDLGPLAYWFGEMVPTAPAYLDLNQDGGATIFDFRDFAANFGSLISFPASRPTGSTAILAAATPSMYNHQQSTTRALVEPEPEPKPEVEHHASMFGVHFSSIKDKARGVAQLEEPVLVDADLLETLAQDRDRAACIVSENSSW